MTVEELSRLVHATGWQEHVTAVAVDQSAAAEVPDGEADVIAGHGGDNGDRPNCEDVEPTGACVDRTENQDRFTGDGQPEILDQHEAGYREVAVVTERRLEAVQHARQLLCCGRDHGPGLGPVTAGVLVMRC